MSEALNNILEVLKIEAETQVRTEYENEVQRLKIEEARLTFELQTMTNDRDKWYDAYHKLYAKMADVESAIRTELDKL